MVDDQFTTLQWSWHDRLLLDDVAKVDYEPGSLSFTIQYHSQASANEQALLALPLMCDRADHADSWVRVLKLVKHLDAARHGLDQQQRARLKQTFKMIASGATLSVSQQVASLACLACLQA